MGLIPAVGPPLQACVDSALSRQLSRRGASTNRRRATAQSRRLIGHLPSYTHLKDVEMSCKYVSIAGPVVQELGGDLVVMGRLTDEHPMIILDATFDGGQRWSVIATQQTELGVIKFWEHPNDREIKHLRDESTSNFVRALYEGASIMEVS